LRRVGTKKSECVGDVRAGTRSESEVVADAPR